MKKLLCIVLSCLMLLGSTAALAEAEPPAVRLPSPSTRSTLRPCRCRTICRTTSAPG